MPSCVDDDPPAAGAADVSLPLLVAADQVGARIAAVVDRRPPLVLSDDAGQTWREAGGGLPAGTAVAIDPDDPDLLLFASESRLFLSEDGGRFWRQPRAGADRDHGARVLVVLGAPRRKGRRA